MQAVNRRSPEEIIAGDGAREYRRLGQGHGELPGR